jgi:DNA-3-methyladenine glycosylase II
MDASLVVSGPLDVARSLLRFRLWGEDPANHLSDGAFQRAVRVDGRWRGYVLTWAGGPDDTRLRVWVPGARGGRVLDAALAEVRHICALDLDVASFYRTAARDPTLAGLIPRLYGLRPTLSPEPFEMLVGSVCAQQVNLGFAFTVRARLVRAFGTPVRVNGQTVYAFPEPGTLARVRVSELRRMQLTVRKAEYIVGLARRIVSGELDLAALRTRSNEEVIEALTDVRGLGRWTAEWFLARGLGRGDVCPAGDLAVRKAFARFYNRGRELSEDAIRRRAALWGPHQNVAVHYLLAAQRMEAGRSGGGT